MYNRFDVGLHPSEPVGAIVGAVKDHVASLKDHALHLRNRMSQIKGALGDKRSKYAPVAQASTILQRTSSDKENGGSSSSSAVSFRNQSSVDGPPIDLAGISLEDSSNSSKEGDWGPQKRPLNADKGKNKTEFSASSAEPNDKAGLIVCPLGGPLENVSHEGK